MMTNPINSYEALIERIWADEDFKKRFFADPKPILAEAGVKVPDSLVKVEVHEDGPNLRNYVLPRKEQLERYNLEGQNPIIRRHSLSERILLTHPNRKERKKVNLDRKIRQCDRVLRTLLAVWR